MKTGSISAGFFLAKNTAHQLPRPNRASKPENTRIEYSIRRGDWRAVLVGFIEPLSRSSTVLLRI